MAKKYVGYSGVFCPHCGERQEKNSEICTKCGKYYSIVKSLGNVPAHGAAGIGWTPYANDESLARNAKRNRMGVIICMVIVSVIIAAVIMISSKMDFEEFKDGGYVKVFGPLAIIWVFWLIWTVIQFGKAKSWEGEVTKKDQKTYERTRKDENGHRWTETTTYYYVYFRDEKGKERKLVQSKAGGWYDYLQVGDKIRYHGKHTDYYEKYDKSGSDQIPCAGCGTSCDARTTYCTRCGTILFKAQAPVMQAPQAMQMSQAMQMQQTMQAPQTIQAPQTARFCPQCGSPIETGAKFCNQCGTKL